MTHSKPALALLAALMFGGPLAGCGSTAGLLAPRLTQGTRHAVWGNRLAGTSFIGLGVLTALLGQESVTCCFSPRTEPVFSPRSEPPLIMDFVLRWGQGMVCLLLFPSGSS